MTWWSRLNLPIESSHPKSVLYEKSTSKIPLFSLIPLTIPVVEDPLPEIKSPIFSLSLSDPNTTNSPSDDLTTCKSLSIWLILSFSPEKNGAESYITLNFGYWSSGINLARPFASVIAIPVLVVNPTTSNLTSKGFVLVINLTSRKLYP